MRMEKNRLSRKYIMEWGRPRGRLRDRGIQGVIEGVEGREDWIRVQKEKVCGKYNILSRPREHNIS